MKVLCPHCERLIALEQFRVQGSSLIITCTRCGEETQLEPQEAAALPLAADRTPAPRPSAPGAHPPRVSLTSSAGASNVVQLRTASTEAIAKAAAAAAADPFAVPPGVCPKCVSPRAAESSTCPRCGVTFDSFREDDVLPPQWLRKEWVELLRNWGDAELHAAVRRKAQQSEALAAVGRLYRLREAVVPEDPASHEGRADVLRLASVPITFRASNEGEVERRKKIVLWATFVVATFIALLLLNQVFRQG